MVIHFNNRQAAIFHLAANGWKQLKNGRFLSRDRSCIAQIAMTFDEIVAVHIWSVR